MSLELIDDAAHHRYVALVDGSRAGLAGYQLSSRVITFTHTEVGDAYAGQGIGSSLARYALDDARARGLRVRPLCPFIKAWIDRHPSYADLVDAA